MFINPDNLTPYQLSVLSNDEIYESLKTEYLRFEKDGQAFEGDLSQIVFRKFITKKDRIRIREKQKFDVRDYVLAFYTTLLNDNLILECKVSHEKIGKCKSTNFTHYIEPSALIDTDVFQKLCTDFLQYREEVRKYLQKNPQLQSKVEKITEKFNESLAQKKMTMDAIIDTDCESKHPWPPSFEKMQEIAQDLQKEFDISVNQSRSIVKTYIINSQVEIAQTQDSSKPEIKTYLSRPKKRTIENAPSSSEIKKPRIIRDIEDKNAKNLTPKLAEQEIDKKFQDAEKLIANELGESSSEKSQSYATSTETGQEKTIIKSISHANYQSIINTEYDSLQAQKNLSNIDFLLQDAQEFIQVDSYYPSC